MRKSQKSKKFVEKFLKIGRCQSKENYFMYEEVFNSDPFIISDLHFGHLMIIKYCNRPNNWQDILIENWNSRIKKEDYVLNLGDFALAHSDDMKLYASLLNGYHYLLRGNHDRKSCKFFEDIGIHLIKEKEIIYKNIIFSHRPINPIPGFYNLRGHTHDKIPTTEFDINCCVESFNYTPKKLSEIVQEFSINLA